MTQAAQAKLAYVIQSQVNLHTNAKPSCDMKECMGNF